MHVFLTGAKQVGKTTVIQRFVAQSGLGADGFVTTWVDGDAGRRLTLSAYDSPPGAGVDVACRDQGRAVAVDGVAGVFDIDGVRILDACGRRDVIIMDEVGALESSAVLFQEAVLRRLEGDVPVLGVVQPKRTAFLDAIRAHPSVTLLTVTPQNRDECVAWLVAQGVRRAGRGAMPTDAR
ncbi:MAG: nucleoside-triphosphatase [Propionibacteriaceae bacterium]|nr:nucleoside-triphosphatase [Propionibacteriaceae bacterium]